MTSILANQIPSPAIKTSAAFTANGTLIVPAGYQLISIVPRETAGKTMPFAMNVGLSQGSNEVCAAAIVTANSLQSSLTASSTFLPTIFVFSATVDTPIWFASGAHTIAGITQASPAVLTYSGTDDQLANGQTIDLSGIVGMTELNGTQAVVANLNTGANTFELTGVDSTLFTAYVSGGTISGWNGASVTVTLQMMQFD